MVTVGLAGSGRNIVIVVVVITVMVAVGRGRGWCSGYSESSGSGSHGGLWDAGRAVPVIIMWFADSTCRRRDAIVRVIMVMVMVVAVGMRRW